MFDDNEDFSTEKLRINKNFAEKFERREKRKELDKFRSERGKDFEKMLEEESSSETSEDENAELLNETVSTKFLTTLAKIRKKDPTIYKKDEKFFNEEEFEIEDDDDSDEEKSKPVYYKDLVRESILNKDKEKKKVVGETPFEEQERLKKEFKMAAEVEEEGGDDLFKVKKKTAKEIEDEEAELQKYIEKEKKKGHKKEAKLVQEFWGKTEDLDETDRFLRRYILTKAWIDKDDMEGEDSPRMDKIDEEDEKRDEEMEEFEAKHNFRFEEPGANQILTHERFIGDSVRVKDTSRAEKRKEKEERKKELISKEKEEIKRIKSTLRSEMLERIQKIEKVAGTHLTKQEKMDKLLQDEFDPDDYDRKMREVYDDEFYEQEDENASELEEYEKELEKQEEEEANNEGKDEQKGNENGPAEADKENILMPKTSIPIINKLNLKESEIQAISEEVGQLWWYCDTCLRGIKEGERRFDCLECEDFTQCKQCADLKDHPHKMKPFVIPKGCRPPLDSEIKKLLEKIKYCAECNYKFTEYDEMYQLKTNEDFFLCTGCIKAEEKKYKRKDFNKLNPEKVDYTEVIKQDPEKLRELGIKDSKLDELIDQYYAVEFEDIISGGIKTRFKYTKVKSNSYGLTDEELLFADDRELNKVVPLKKLAPYREDEGTIEMRKVRQGKQNVKRNAEENIKILKKDITKLTELDDKLDRKKKKLKASDIKKLHQQKQKVLKTLTKVPKPQKERPNIQIEHDIPEEETMEIEQEEQNTKVDKKKKRKTKPLSENRLKAYGIGDE